MSAELTRLLRCNDCAPEFPCWADDHARCRKNVSADTPTPRTDALRANYNVGRAHVADLFVRCEMLERELAQAREQIAGLIASREDAIKLANSAGAQRDQWRACAENLASNLKAIQSVMIDLGAVVTIGNAALAEFDRLEKENP